MMQYLRSTMEWKFYLPPEYVCDLIKNSSRDQAIPILQRCSSMENCFWINRLLIVMITRNAAKRTHSA